MMERNEPYWCNACQYTHNGACPPINPRCTKHGTENCDSWMCAVKSGGVAPKDHRPLPCKPLAFDVEDAGCQANGPAMFGGTGDGLQAESMAARVKEAIEGAYNRGYEAGVKACITRGTVVVRVEPIEVPKRYEVVTPDEKAIARIKDKMQHITDDELESPKVKTGFQCIDNPVVADKEALARIKEDKLGKRST